MRRLIQQERQKSRDHIYDKLFQLLSKKHKDQLDDLLDTKNKSYSELYRLKQVPGRASANAIIKITEKLDKVKAIKVLELDLSWLNNNLQRWMNRYVRIIKRRRFIWIG